MRVTGLAVMDRDVLVYELSVLVLGREGRQPALDHFLLSLVLDHPGGIGFGAFGQVADGGQDALVFYEAGSSATEPLTHSSRRCARTLA